MAETYVSGKPNPFQPGSDEWRDWESRRATEQIHGDFGRDATNAEAQRKIDAKSLDPNCPPDYPYKSRKEGSGGGCVEYPDNCPDGMTAWGENKCISGSDPRATGGGPGQAAAGSPGNPQNESLGKLMSSSIWGRVSDQFNLGVPNATANKNEFSLTGDAQNKAVGGTTRLLNGGGLLWGGAGGWGTGAAAPAPAVPGPAPAPQAAPQGLASMMAQAQGPATTSLVPPAAPKPILGAPVNPVKIRKLEELQQYR